MYILERPFGAWHEVSPYTLASCIRVQVYQYVVWLEVTEQHRLRQGFLQLWLLCGLFCIDIACCLFEARLFNLVMCDYHLKLSILDNLLAKNQAS